MKKMLIVFITGLVEQTLYTLYILSVGRYMILASTVLMMTYMTTYLLLMNYALKDNKAVKLLITYAIACGVGNYCAMALKIIK